MRGKSLSPTGADHLGLGGQPAQRGGVQHPGAVALERGTARALGRFRDPPLQGGAVVPRYHLGHAGEATDTRRQPGGGQRVSLPLLSRTARPASSRATGTRNGEHDT